MAAYTVATAKHATLTANSVDTVTLTGFTFLGNRSVEVFNHSTGADLLWFTTDGTTPAPKGDDCYFVRPGTGLTATLRSTQAGNSAVVKLTCSSAVDYSVTTA
jgi:hypothetical protein